MQKYRDVLQDRGGKAIANALVRVQTYPGGVDATIYSDDGVTEADNPLTTGANGEFSFYAADGNYQLVVTATGFSTRTITDIQLEDPGLASAGVFTTISATGQITAADGSAAAPAYAFSSSSSTGIYRSTGPQLRFSLSGTDYFAINTVGVDLPSAGALRWSTTTIGGGADLTLFRDAANTLAQRNGTNAQGFRLYNTYTDASNYERLAISASSTVSSIVQGQAGTGSARTLQIYTQGSSQLQLGTNSTIRWVIATDGHLITASAADNTYDIGASGATRPRNVHVGTNVITKGLSVGTAATTAVDGLIYLSRSANAAMVFQTSGTTDGQLRVTGTGTIGFTNSTGSTTWASFSSSGTTLGSSSSDTLTINAGTWTLGSNASITRAAGQLATSAVAVISETVTWSGDSGGLTDGRAFVRVASVSGANAIAAATLNRTAHNLSVSAAVSSAYLEQGSLTHSGSGAISNVYGFVFTPNVTGTGSISVSANSFYAPAPTLSSTGSIGTLYGFRSGNLGHATLVGTAVGFKADDMTAGTTGSRGMQLSLSAGTGKHNLYIDGTAVNYIAGQIQAGDGSASTPAYSFSSESNLGLFRVSGRLVVAVAGLDRFSFGAASASGFNLSSAMPVTWASTVESASSYDLALWRDAANTLAQRNGTNAQALRVYNTYTDSSNYERGGLTWSSNVLKIGSEAAGTGTGRGVQVGTFGSAGNLEFWQANTGRWYISGGHFLAYTDNTNDIGATSANRPRNVHVAGEVRTGAAVVVGGNLTVNGNATLGDSSADTLTINAGTWTYGSNVVVTRNLGTAPAGSQTFLVTNCSFVGDAGGTTEARGFAFSNLASGANAVAGIAGIRPTITSSSSNTVTVGRSVWASASATSTGSISTVRVYESFVQLSGAGNMGTVDEYLAGAPVLSSTGAITLHRGFVASDLGHATLVGTAIGFLASDMTAATAVRGFQSSVTAGTGKHNLYIDGTAINYIAGQIQAGDGSVSAPAYSFASDPNTGIYRVTDDVIGFASAGVARAAINFSRFVLADVGGVAWSGSSSLTGTQDLILLRDAANTLAQRNGTSAQAFRLYNTYTDGSNYERLNVAWNSSILDIETAQAGTGTARTLRIGTSGAANLIFKVNGSDKWTISATDSAFLATNDNTVDIGRSGTFRPRTGYFGTSVDVAGYTLGSGTLSHTSNTGNVQLAGGTVGSSANVILYGGSHASLPNQTHFRAGTTINMKIMPGGALGIVDGITAPGTDAGFAQIYVDSADGDLKVKFGDGTVKTLATDT